MFEAIIAPLAEEYGVPFTYEEALAELYDAKLNSSDEELDAIAASGFCIIWGGTTEDWMYDSCIETAFGRQECRRIGVGIFYVD